MSKQTTTLQESLTATLLKSVLPNSLLKEIMTDALVCRGLVTDLNAVPRSGVYSFYNPANAPLGNLYGVAISAQVSSVIELQVIFTNYGRIMWREKWETWRDWIEVVTKVPS